MPSMSRSCRTSSSPPISLHANASVIKPRSRQCWPTLEKTSKSDLLKPLHFTLESTRRKWWSRGGRAKPLCDCGLFTTSRSVRQQRACIQGHQISLGSLEAAHAACRIPSISLLGNHPLDVRLYQRHDFPTLARVPNPLNSDSRLAKAICDASCCSASPGF